MYLFVCVRVCVCACVCVCVFTERCNSWFVTEEVLMSFLYALQSSSTELARFVLAEVPKQVTDYYKMRGMQPNKPPS